MGKYIDLTCKRERGKPRAYTPEELEHEFYEFLKLCKKCGDMPTIAGFKAHLEITNMTYNNYERNPDYFYVFDRMSNYLEHATVNCGYKKISDVIKKSLLQKYHKYADKQETKEDVTHDFKDMTDDELIQKAEELLGKIKKEKE